MQFDESKHPRDKDGKFTDGNGTGKKAYNSQDKFGNMVRELPQGARDAIDKKIEQLEQEQRREIKGKSIVEVDAATEEPKFNDEKEARNYYTKELSNFAAEVDISGAKNAHSLHSVNKTLKKLTSDFPIAKLEKIVINRSIRGANAQTNGVCLEISASYLNDPGAPDDWQAQTAQYSELIEKYTEAIKTSTSKSYVKKCKDYIAEMKEAMKYRRWSFSSSSKDKVGLTIAHEYGHILADQICGQVNGSRYCKDYNRTWAKRELIGRVFAEVRTSGEIYQISRYANTNAKEFFAESFCAYYAGEQLPENVEKMIEEVLR